jgi:hypothetical protein
VRSTTSAVVIALNYRRRCILWQDASGAIVVRPQPILDRRNHIKVWLYKD